MGLFLLLLGSTLLAGIAIPLWGEYAERRWPGK